MRPGILLRLHRVSVASASAPDLSLQCNALQRPTDLNSHNEERRGPIRNKQIQPCSKHSVDSKNTTVPGHSQPLPASLIVGRYVVGWEVRSTIMSNNLSLTTIQQIQHPTFRSPPKKTPNLAADRTLSRAISAGPN